MAELSCTANKKNTGRPDCSINYGPVKGYILIPEKTEIATTTLAETEATWTALFNNAISTRAFPINLPDLINGTSPSQDEPTSEETAFSGGRTFGRDGNKRNVLIFANVPVCYIKNLRSLNNQKWEAFEITENGYIKGWSPDGVKMRGFKVKYNAGNQSLPESSDASAKLSIMVDYLKPGQWDDSGIVAKPIDFEVEDLVGIKNVDFTEISSTTSEAIVDIQTICGGTGISGLVITDIKITRIAGLVNVIPSLVTEDVNIPGRYTIAATLTTGDYYFELQNQPAMATTGYETITAITITTV